MFQQAKSGLQWSLFTRCIAARYSTSTQVIKLSSEQTASAQFQRVKNKLAHAPDIKTFLKTLDTKRDAEDFTDVIPPYMENFSSHGKKVYFESYGCQMNVNDAEYAWAVLKNKGYTRTEKLTDADVILLVTCSIREKAENRIWARLDKLKELKDESDVPGFPKIGLLGCMAERLKKKILEKQRAVDVIAGPDAYRDLPRLLQKSVESSTTTINVMLSTDETYADIMPVRFDGKSKKAFVSIMRGCDNMCSYCIVPFTRGRERSRPVTSILEEVKMLSDQGIKQVTLLGQNVNSYRDVSELQYSSCSDSTSLSKGFKTIYKPKVGGMRFADLLDKVSLIDPDMRIRFTSPHPKDFPDEVLHVVRERNNICNQIHMPAQSGSSAVLEKMRRGYTKESYLELAHKIRNFIPGVCLSTDMISGFCGETEKDHLETLSLMKEVKYEMAFLFAYSMRNKTHAYHRMKDDVPKAVKLERLQAVKSCFLECLASSLRNQIGQRQLVLIDGYDKKSDSYLCGRNDGNIKIKFPSIDIPRFGDTVTSKITPKPGDYVAVKVTDALASSLVAEPMSIISLAEFSNHFPTMSSAL